MARYTKAEREEAALICAIAASSAIRETTWDVSYRLTGSKNGTASSGLADAAWREAVGDEYRNSVWMNRRSEVYAEAEALIRTGWTP
jgi:hypothetical protein